MNEHSVSIWKKIVFIISSLVCCVWLLLLRYNISLLNISIYCSQWNDELSYYKQIEGIIKYGIPKGYFGYNESKALIGTFGPWSPVLLFPYSVVFKVIGIGTYRILITNIILSFFAFFICIELLELESWRVMAIVLAVVGFANYARYMMSISPELIVILSTSLLFSVLIKYYRTNNDRYLDWFSIILIFLTLSRGYYAIYGIAGCVLAKNKKKKMLIIISTISSCLAYYMLVHFFCAQYFSPLINMDLVRMIWTSPIGFIKSCIALLNLGIKESVDYILSIKQGGSYVGALYLLTFVSIICAIVFGFVRRSMPVYVLGMCFMLMVVSIWLLYDVRTGVRHFIASMFAMTLLNYVCLLKNKSLLNCFVFFIACIMLFVTYFGEDEFGLMPPKKDLTIEMEVNSSDLDINFADNAWDNTVIWTLGCDYRYLYALPGGVGINICADQYVMEFADELHSKYIAISNESEEMVALAHTKNWQLVCSIGAVDVYCIRV